MDFYYVNYINEHFHFDEHDNKNGGYWDIISSNKIIVVASNLKEATDKINKCFDIYNTARNVHYQRCRQIGEIKKTHGLDINCDFYKNTVRTIDEKV